jgi:hypothetical protein
MIILKIMKISAEEFNVYRYSVSTPPTPTPTM